MEIRPLSARLRKFLLARGLARTWAKQSALFCANPRHPSLHTELMEPHHLHIYSFRLTKKYRAMFVYCGDGTIEVLDVNNHYA